MYKTFFFGVQNVFALLNILSASGKQKRSRSAKSSSKAAFRRMSCFLRGAVFAVIGVLLAYSAKLRVIEDFKRGRFEVYGF